MKEDVRTLAKKIVSAAWEHAKEDVNFRKKLMAAPEETLKHEGLEEIDDFLHKLKSADTAALEAAFESKEQHSTC